MIRVPVIVAGITVVVVGAVIALALILNRRFTVRFGNLEANVEGTHQIAREINQAVNHRPPDQPTLYEQTAECRRTLDELKGLPPKVDRIGGDLAAHLDWHGGQPADVRD